MILTPQRPQPPRIAGGFIAGHTIDCFGSQPGKAAHFVAAARYGDIDADSYRQRNRDMARSISRAGRTAAGRTIAALPISQKEKAKATNPLRGTDRPQSQRYGMIERLREKPILRGTKNSLRKYSSCPEEWGMSPWRHACPCCVAAGAVFARKWGK